ncbi:MAG: cupin domain-containing protein, partial [Burkholderiales bacterium]|nr:cupin domain-containing protein [Burkholderiales bacterium]
MSMDHSLLGGLSPSSFLQRHWQKQPLLIRAAIPGFRDVLTLRSLIALSGHEACEARLVVADRGHYEVLHGPFSPRIFSELPENNWTLLVQGVNNVCRGTRALLHRFAFLPYARLDDVMVSYAAPGGGVGPHFDSYDVFLLQGHGRRMWQVGTQSDLELIPDADLRILKRFHPDGSCKVRCGDMLYLPPRFAHNGIAVDSCITYSIGFRAPDYEELKVQFLAYLDE